MASFRLPVHFLGVNYVRALVESAVRREAVRVTVSYPAGTAPAALSYELAMLPAGANVAFNAATDDADINNVFIYNALKNRRWVDGAGQAQKWGWGWAVPVGVFDGSNAGTTSYAQYKVMLAEGGNVALMNHGSHAPASAEGLYNMMAQDAAALVGGGLPEPRGAVRPGNIYGSVKYAVDHHYTVVQAEGFDRDENGVEGEGYVPVINFGDYFHQAYRLTEYLNSQYHTAIMSRAAFDNFVSGGAQGFADAKSFFTACLAYQADKNVPLMFSFYTHKPENNASQQQNFGAILDHLATLKVPVLNPVQFGDRLRVVKFAGRGTPVKALDTFTFELDLSTLPAGSGSHDMTLQLPAAGSATIRVEGAESFGVNAGAGIVEIYKRPGFGGLAATRPS